MSRFLHDAISGLTTECAYKISESGEIKIEKINPETVTVEKIKLRAKELESEYDAKKYQRDRQYPEITDQLDMIYWDKKNGTKKWEEAIDKVKAENPKPE